MSQVPDNTNPYESYLSPDHRIAAWTEEWERTTFLRRTYAHLAGAIAVFVGIETFILSSVSDATLDNLMRLMMAGRWNWLLVLGAFMVVSWIASSWASSATSLAMQYAGLGLYVVAEAVIFLPLLYLASRFAPGAIPAAGIMTAIVFSGLTAVVFFTRADFSWLGRYLMLACFAALGLIVASVFIPGFPLGLWFSGAMVLVAAGYILYYTSQVLHQFRTDQYVAAALALFASVALLFWYVLQIFLSFGRD